MHFFGNDNRLYHCYLRRGRKRLFLRLAVIILVSLYIVSLARVFRLKSQSNHTIPSDTAINANEIEHRKRLSDFKQRQQHHQDQDQGQEETQTGPIPNPHNESPETQFAEFPRNNGISNNEQSLYDDGNVPDRKDLPFEHQQRSSTSSSTRIFVDGTVQNREKLQLKLERIAHTTRQEPGSNKALNASQHHPPLWELSDFVPPWMKEYFAWHEEERRTLIEDVWNQWKTNETNTSSSSSSIDGKASVSKFLVVQCLQQPQISTNLRATSKKESSTLPSSSCGSLSERLALLPYWLRMAHETNRLLFIHWTVPTDLSQYFDPPVGGCDWRAPMWLKQMLEDTQQGILINDESKLLSDSSYLQSLDSESLLRVQVKHSLNLEERYNVLRNRNTPFTNVLTSSSSDKNAIVEEEAAFHQVFHDVWIILFVPSIDIRKNLYNAFRGNRGMKTGHYTSIDLTSAREIESFPSPFQQEKDDAGASLIRKAKRVFECASRLQPKEPFFVITDDANVTRALQDYSGAEKKGEKPIISVFARYIKDKKKSKELLPQKIIDLDAASVPIHMPELFYDIFVNLYVMAMGRCIVSYGPGNLNGNGSTLSRLASLMGYDSNCYFQFSDGNLNASTLLGGSYCVESTYENPSDSVTAPAIFDNREIPIIDHHFSRPMIRDGADFLIDMHQRIQQHGEQHQHNSKSLLKKENKFPQWIEEYLAWHRATKAQITRSNWNSSNYLIVGCLETSNCGGISDRLKPLPMFVWEAYQSQRILLIWWDRPKPLEEWLIPPNHNDGGVDWTVPLFLREEILRAQKRNTATTWAKGRKSREKGNHFIVYHIQTADAGEKLYFDEQASYVNRPSTNISASGIASGSDPSTSVISPIVGSSYQDVFHHLFRRFFTPAPRLAGLLDSKMKEHNLVPGEYSAVHLRAMYGKRKDRDLQEIIELAVLGVNCASNLFPGAPVFFASDTSFAVDSARAYGKLHGLPIVSLDFEHDIDTTNGTNATRNSDPIHLDKDPAWKDRSASAYDPTFVDLYMLAQSRCVAFSNGGYGTFGSLLSYESKCNMRYFKGKHKIKKCIWMNKEMVRQRLELPNATDVINEGRGVKVSVVH